MIEKIAHVISVVMSPLLVPTFAIILILNTSYLAVVPASVKWIVTLAVLGITGVLPLLAILLMMRLGLVGDLDLQDRRERWAPYIVSALCYLGCALFLWRVGMPRPVPQLLLGGALVIGVQMIVTRWWKISAHGAGTGALVAMILREGTSMLTVGNVLPWLLLAIIMAGLTGTSRLILERHTLGQVLAGWANGFLCVWLCSI